MGATKCPYKPRSIRWALCNEDFSDLTVEQIGEVFGVDRRYIFRLMRDILDRTGIRVRYTKLNTRGEPLGVVEFGRSRDDNRQGGKSPV